MFSTSHLSYHGWPRVSSRMKAAPGGNPSLPLLPWIFFVPGGYGGFSKFQIIWKDFGLRLRTEWLRWTKLPECTGRLANCMKRLGDHREIWHKRMVRASGNSGPWARWRSSNGSCAGAPSFRFFFVQPEFSQECWPDTHTNLAYGHFVIKTSDDRPSVSISGSCSNHWRFMSDNPYSGSANTRKKVPRSTMIHALRRVIFCTQTRSTARWLSLVASTCRLLDHKLQTLKTRLGWLTE